jgi:transposase
MTLIGDTTMCGWCVSPRACHGLDGLGDRQGSGRKRRITEAQRSAIIGMARSLPPGQLVRDATGELSADDERGPAQWTLDTLAQTARDAGIQVGRSQVRRILLAMVMTVS